MTDEQESLARLAMAGTKHELARVLILAGGGWTEIETAELDDEFPGVLLCTDPEGEIVSFALSQIAAVKDVTPKAE